MSHLEKILNIDFELTMQAYIKIEKNKVCQNYIVDGESS